MAGDGNVCNINANVKVGSVSHLVGRVVMWMEGCTRSGVECSSGGVSLELAEERVAGSGTFARLSVVLQQRLFLLHRLVTELFNQKTSSNENRNEQKKKK